MKFDFHMHSVYSDGSSTLEEIFEIGKNLKMSAISITDHDTVLGLEKAVDLSKKNNIPIIPAVEFTAVEKGVKFHVLGYNIDYKSLELIKYSETLLNYLNNRSKEQIKLMHNNGIEIEEEEFFKEGKGGPLYRAKMLKTLSKYGYLKEEEIMMSLKAYFGKEAPYYVEDTYKYCDFHQICELIKRNNGIIVLAHPIKVKDKDEELYLEIINSGLLDGVEIYHPSNDMEIREELKEIAKHKDIIVTGGSDYHGIFNKLKTPICGIDIPEEVYKNLYPYFVNKIV